MKERTIATDLWADMHATSNTKAPRWNTKRGLKIAPFSLEIFIGNIKIRKRRIFLASETVGNGQPVHRSPQERFGITSRAHLYRDICLRESAASWQEYGVKTVKSGQNRAIFTRNIHWKHKNTQAQNFSGF